MNDEISALFLDLQDSSDNNAYVECCPYLEPECMYGCDKSHPGCPFAKKECVHHEA